MWLALFIKSVWQLYWNVVSSWSFWKRTYFYSSVLSGTHSLGLLVQYIFKEIVILRREGNWGGGFNIAQKKILWIFSDSSILWWKLAIRLLFSIKKSTKWTWNLLVKIQVGASKILTGFVSVSISEFLWQCDIGRGERQQDCMCVWLEGVVTSGPI